MSKSLVSYIWWFFRLIHNHNNHNSQLNPCPTNELGSQLCGHWLCSQPLDFLYQCKNNVSNMNIFSKQLTYPEMVSRTAGDNCGKADGDYLAWESAEWVLKWKGRLASVRWVWRISVGEMAPPSFSSSYTDAPWMIEETVVPDAAVMLFGDVWVLVYLGGILGCQSCFGGYLRLHSMQNWAVLSKPTILAQHWNARFFHLIILRHQNTKTAA